MLYKVYRENDKGNFKCKFETENKDDAIRFTCELGCATATVVYTMGDEMHIFVPQSYILSSK